MVIITVIMVVIAVVSSQSRLKQEPEHAKRPWQQALLAPSLHCTTSHVRELVLLQCVL